MIIRHISYDACVKNSIFYNNYLILVWQVSTVH